MIDESLVVLIGLGAFHGINPAMGWLFAVALGLHRRSRTVVLASLVPIALGHALAVALVAVTVVALGRVVDRRAISTASGLVLNGWALYHQLTVRVIACGWACAPAWRASPSGRSSWRARTAPG